MFIRSPVTLIEGQPVELNMISTMGNGFTFPLQTIIFASITEACYNAFGWAPRKRVSRAKSRSSSVGTFTSDTTGASPIQSLRDLQNRSSLQYGVFGDDIICKKGIYNLLVNVLSDLGMRVNMTKSFSEGPFRESCGQDWLHGLPVRPVYVVELTTIQDRFSLINRLIRWSTRSGLKLPATANLLWATIPEERRQLIPCWESDDAGIQVPRSVAEKSDKILRLQTPRLRKMLSANCGALVYQRDTPIKRSYSFWYRRKVDGSYVILCKDDPSINWSGVLLASVGGYINGTDIVQRSRVVRYQESTFGCSSSWDGYHDVSRFHGWLGTAADWKSACEWYCYYIFNL